MEQSITTALPRESRLRKMLTMLAVMVLTAFGTTQASQAVTITQDTGWVDGAIYDVKDVVTFDFTLTSNGFFSLSDCCVPGDIWTIAGSIVGASSLGLIPTNFQTGLGSTGYDGEWLNAALSHFQVALVAGYYSITVTGDGGGGIPAGFGVRVDTAAVPLPAAGLLLLGALGGLGALRRRKSNRAA